MIMSDDWLIIPVRSFSDAKRRLASALGAQERAHLASAMLRDVLLAATNVRDLWNIAIVTSSLEVAQFVKDWDVSLIDDRGADGLSEAVQFALGKLAMKRAKTVAVIPSDVPLIQSQDIHELFVAAKAHDVALAPASADGGTNGLALSSPSLMGPCFGIASFARHIEAAQSIGLSPAFVNNIRFGLDIDEPARLSEFLSIGGGTHAGRYLNAIGIGSAAA